MITLAPFLYERIQIVGVPFENKVTIPKAILEKRIVVRERSPIFVILLMRDCRIWTEFN